MGMKKVSIGRYIVGFFTAVMYTVNYVVLAHFLTAVSGGQVYTLIVLDLLRQISGN